MIFAQPKKDSPALRVAKIEAEIRGVVAQSGVTSKDQEFLRSVRKFNVLSERQENWLADIEKKVFKVGDRV